MLAIAIILPIHPEDSNDGLLNPNKGNEDNENSSNGGAPLKL